MAGYFGVVAAGYLTPLQPRFFWTVLLPLAVLFIVLVGFHPWRSLCPLAAFGELGRRFGGSQRRVPDWLERGHFVVPLSLLGTLLLLRLVATNGDGRWLSGLLVVLALAAIGVNWGFTGKTWCNFFCPVSVVERIYTDPASLVAAESSQCARCTACKKSCPDIDQENNYWRELGAGGRRVATYAFPGVVLAFYTYFWLRAGDWEAYFDGRWTRLPVTRELVLGAGFFFAPSVPAIVAAALTLVGFAFVSWAVFRTIDAATRRWVDGADRHRHLLLSLAAFTAFSLFYVFAGAPTLRKIPFGTRAFAFVAPAVAVLVLARRWDRSREAYIRDKGAAKLLRNWPFAGEPPTDPLEAYAKAQASEQAREQLLAGYAQTLRDVVADGLVDESEMKLLDEIRRQFGITPREHERVVAKLAEDERQLLASGKVATVEQRLQLESYRAALTEALLRSADDGEIDSLRLSFGVSAEDHEVLLARLRSGSGQLLQRARREFQEAQARREERVALAAPPTPHDSLEFLRFLLARAEAVALDRLYDVLAVVGDGDRIAALRSALTCADRASRAAALNSLREACPAASEIIDALEPLVARPLEGATPSDSGTIVARLAHLAADADPFLRAAAVWGLVASEDAAARASLETARNDADPLVREAATSSAEATSFADSPRIARMQSLRRVPLFSELDPDDLLDLAELVSEEELAEGAALCEQGQPDAGDLFAIVTGRAAVSVRAADGGRETELAELGPGEVVGELALLDGSPRSATVRAKGGALRVLRIPAAAFRNRLLPRGRVARSLLLTLTRRLRDVSSRVSVPRPSGPSAR